MRRKRARGADEDMDKTTHTKAGKSTDEETHVTVALRHRIVMVSSGTTERPTPLNNVAAPPLPRAGDRSQLRNEGARRQQSHVAIVN